MILILLLVIFVCLLIMSNHKKEYFTVNREVFKEEDGSDYRGFQNKTLSGKMCKKWPQKFIDKHNKGYDKGISNNNYCRNPDSSDSIWCYTNDSFTEREYCEPLSNVLTNYLRNKYL